MRTKTNSGSKNLLLALILLIGAISASALTFHDYVSPLGIVREGSFFANFVTSLYAPSTSAAIIASDEPASVRTNKSHYSPGDTAKITGENFGANETVTLQVTHTDGTPNTGGGHEPWTVTSDGNGFFNSTWYVDPDDSLDSTFLLTAVSATRSASATFSDPGPSADLDQCRNGTVDDPELCVGDGSGASGWVNGNVGGQQGHLIEGYSIPYRMRMEELTPGEWTLDIGYDTIHEEHAIDFLTHYDVSGGSNATPTVPSHNLVFGHASECKDPSDSAIDGAGNVNNCPPIATPTSTFDIPKPIIPDSASGEPPCNLNTYPGGEVEAGAISCPGATFDAIADAGQAYMTMWNGTITNIEYIQGQQNVDTGGGKQHTMMRVYFTVSADDVAADDGNVVLAWGGHIARQQDWGVGNSAGAQSGSPYHMNLHGLCAGSTENDGTLCTDGGAQDRSLSAAAVFETGTVIINKVIQNNTLDGTFGYTATGSGLPANFELTTVNGTAQVIYSGILPGAKTVNESTIPQTHEFVSLECDDPDDGTTVNGTTANIDLDGSETVTCTYTNRENFTFTHGRIVILKDTVPNDTQSFTFTPSYPGVPPYAGGTFSLMDGQSNDSCGVGVNCLQAGVPQTVTETPNPAYATTASCADVEGEVFDPATGTLSNIPVNQGQTTYCTFTNRKPDAQIDLTPLVDTNPVNQPHRITATVQQDDTYTSGAPGDGATGFGPAPDGTLVTFSLLNNNAGATFVDGVNTCTTTNGSCFVDINTSTAGGVDIHATTTFSVLGVSLTRATGTGGLNSADAHKTYVDAQIDVTPLTDTNPVGQAHTIMATVQQDDGIPAGAPGDSVTGFGPAPNGTTVTFSFVTNTAGATFVGDDNDCTTTNGSCSVQINSTSAGLVIVQATTTFSVGGQSLTRTTGTGGLNSAHAQKVYVDAQIDITPLVDTNPIGEAHTFTATVQQDDGIDAPGGDGVTGWAPAPNGTTVVFSFVTNTIGATFVGNDNDCTTTAGSCTVQINSNAPGTVVVQATTTFSVGGQSLTRTTGTGGNNSANAEKTYVSGVIIVDKVTDPAGDPQLFDFDASWLGGATDFQLADATAPFNSGDLAPGPYSVAEITPAGWDLTSATCSGDDDGTDPSAIQLDAGETITCTFYNQKDAVIIVDKVTDPTGDPQLFDFDASWIGGTPDFQLADATTPYNSGDLVPGPYSVTEIVPAGWDLTGATCSGDDDGTDPSAIQLDAGETITCTFYNQKDAYIIVDKVTDPTGDPQLFDFNTNWIAGTPDFQLADGTTPFNSGDLSPNTYSVSETVPTGWDLTSATCQSNQLGDASTPGNISLQAGETVICTFNNTKRGKVDLTKTFRGGALTDPNVSFQFQIRQGASETVGTGQGTILSEEFANSTNGGNVDFATLATSNKNGILEAGETELLLVPGDYQICEYIQVGWDSTIRDMLDAFVPEGAGDPQTIDNSFVCAPFTITPGETEVITIDNLPPPGGMAKTIGFWKNHASCKASNGKQDPVLDEVLATFPIALNQTTHGVYIGNYYVDTCLEAVALLDKRTYSTTKKGGSKAASDPAYNMAAQLMAAKLNLQAGADNPDCLDDIVAEADALLIEINFNGLTIPSYGNGSAAAAKKARINYLAGLLDAYNNNELNCNDYVPLP